MYLLYGEETYLKENALKKIKKSFGKETIKGINYIMLDDSNIGELISQIETPAFGYEKKLIIAKNTKLFKTEGKRKNAELTQLRDKINEYIKNNIDLIDKSVILVFVEDEIDSRLSIVKTISKIGEVNKYEFQKPAQLVKNISSICKAYKVNIENSTIMYLIECCGTSMQELVNELRKLIEYTGENGTITKKEIDLLCSKKIESIIFDLTDSLGGIKKANSIQILRNLLYAKEPIQKILITLYNHFKKIYFTKISQRTGKNIAEALKLKSNQMFLVNKYARQAQNFKEVELAQILQKLRELDYKYKVRINRYSNRIRNFIM